MTTEVSGENNVRFPFGGILVTLGAFAGGPLAALILLLMVGVGDFMNANSFPEWLSLIVLFPLAALSLLVVIASFVLMITLPFTLFRFMDRLFAWKDARKAKKNEAPLIKATA